MLKKEKKRAADAVSQLERVGSSGRPTSTHSDGPVSNGHSQPHGHAQPHGHTQPHGHGGHGHGHSRMAADFAGGEGTSHRRRASSVDDGNPRRAGPRENSSDFEEKTKKKICEWFLDGYEHVDRCVRYAKAMVIV